MGRPTKLQPVADARPRAVVCDDDPMSRQLARGLLTAAGFDVIAGVGTAVDALQVVMTHKPDVLVLDLGLPGMSGETIIPAIRDAVPHCAVVVCSAFDMTKAIQLGAVYVAMKGAHKELETMLSALALRPPAAVA